MSQPRVYTYRKLNPFIKSFTFTNGEAFYDRTTQRIQGRYVHLEYWRWTKKIRRMEVWSGHDWVNVPDNILEAEARDVSLLCDYSKILGVDFVQFLNDEIQMGNDSTGEV